MDKKKGYHDYVEVVNKIDNPKDKVIAELLLDIRYTLNNIDKVLKNLVPSTKQKPRLELVNNKE